MDRALITPDALVDSARAWLGVPFVHQGRTRCGVDCAGLLVALLRECAALPRHFAEPRAYGRIPNGELREIVERHCTRTRTARAGVLILIRWPRDTEPRHVALCTGPTIIHAYERSRVVIEHSYRGPWLRNTHSMWCIPTVVYE